MRRMDTMKRTVGIGIQDYTKLIERNLFYIDKTYFIRDWWESNDEVTLITRPRRFGKTLTLRMAEAFFSTKFENRADLFQNQQIWQYEQYRKVQGTWPVLFLSFAGVKDNCYKDARYRINLSIYNLYQNYRWLLETDQFSEEDRRLFASVTPNMDESVAASSLSVLCGWLKNYYGKSCIILMDEYDTPMHEAFVFGYWDEITSLMRNLFNNTFKTNPALERALLTGITRVSRESLFSDLNNLEIVTTTSDKYSSVFGFTEAEVFAAMEEQGLTDFDSVKSWYDGFTFGTLQDIYNPWSITNYLDKRVVGIYWANTSSNQLAGKLIREGSTDLKKDFETLLQGGSIRTVIDEEIVYDQLTGSPYAVWSLLLAAGYLKVVQLEQINDGIGDETVYTLRLTNREVRLSFRHMVSRWFDAAADSYNQFIRALLCNDLDAMNQYMNRVALQTFSYFDTGNQSTEAEPERFYHGFVLGLLVDLADRYVLKSNRESGFGRYDILLKPRDPAQMLPACIIEFKVHNPRKEQTLQDTVAAAHTQIRDMRYAEELLDEGISRTQIHCYGFAFKGKQVLIG